MSEWGKVPRDAFMDKRLTRLDLRVLGILCTHAHGRTGLCTRRQEAIAEEVEAARESVNRVMKKLVKLGYVSARARPGMKRSLEYRVLVSDGTAGQLGLFDAQETLRVAKPTKTIRDRKITSVVTPEVTSVVTSSITSNKQTLVNRGCAEARERLAEKPAPANDDRPDPTETDAVPFLPAIEDASDDVRRIQAEAAALGRRLRDAAGEALNAASAGLLSLAEPYAWLKTGCDLETDILPTIAGVAARHRRGPIRTWEYFTPAVIEARDRRLAMAARSTAVAPGGLGPPPRERAPPQSTGDRMFDIMMAITRRPAPDLPEDDDGPTIDGLAQRL